MMLASELEVGRAAFGMRGRWGMATNFVASSDVDRIGIAAPAGNPAPRSWW
jgi:hypothetical protein